MGVAKSLAMKRSIGAIGLGLSLLLTGPLGTGCTGEAGPTDEEQEEVGEGESPLTSKVVTASADAWIDGSRPTTNLGSDTVVRVDAWPSTYQGLVRFVVPAFSGTVKRAVVRFWVIDESPDAPALYSTTGSWTESGVTWSNRPAIGDKLADLGAIARRVWVEYDVTAKVKTAGSYDFALVTTNGDGVHYASRESGANAPQLVVETEAGGAQDAGAADSGGPGALEAVHYTGRFDTSNAAAPRFGWSASQIRTRFNGTAIAVSLTDGGNNMFEVILDGAVAGRFLTRSGTQTYTLASGLGAGLHDVTIFKQMEAQGGAVTFRGFTVTGGAIVPSSYPVARRLEIIGDSISTGYGNEGVDPCPFGRETENQYLAYGPLAARAVGAEVDTIAWQGRGMYRNWGGSTSDTVPLLYDRTIGTESGAWNYGFAPDAIVVNLGANDFGQGDPGSAFVTTYDAFVRKLRGKYPRAWIFAAVGPTLWGAKLPIAKGYVQEVVSRRKAAGDARVSYLEFPTHPMSDGRGCNGHPSLLTHQKMSVVLASELRAKLGW